MLYIEKKHLEIIRKILKKYPYSFFVYGSRVKGNAKKFSDLDLCYKEKIPSKDLVNLVWEFQESDLPFKVELADWHTCPPRFKSRIEKDLIPFDLEAA